MSCSAVLSGGVPRDRCGIVPIPVDDVLPILNAQLERAETCEIQALCIAPLLVQQPRHQHRIVALDVGAEKLLDLQPVESTPVVPRDADTARSSALQPLRRGFKDTVVAAVDENRRAGARVDGAKMNSCKRASVLVEIRFEISRPANAGNVFRSAIAGIPLPAGVDVFERSIYGPSEQRKILR